MRLPAFIFAAVLAATTAVAEPRHGISVFGELDYPADFKHFKWVNPDAPKGGALRIRDLGTFDSLNLFILRALRVPKGATI